MNMVDPQGQILADAEDREDCIRARLVLACLRTYRAGLAFLADLEGP
jgi:hypothetical protein